MKRFYIPLLLMAAAAVAACQNKAAVEEPASEQGNYVFTLKASAPDAETKTDYSSPGKFSWSEGDAISVLFHKGDDNKFFTLTATTINGASADFSGIIDEGYELGNSLNDIKWALYPAGNHTFDASSSKYINFNIPATMDLSSHYSSNVPLYAKGDGDIFAFKLLDATYKFTFTDIPSGVSKVKFVVENQSGYDISGNIPLSGLTGSPYFSPSNHSATDARAARTFIGNVTNGTSVPFYVPVRRAQAWFTPKITLYDADTDDQIFTKTAASAGTIESAHIQPITGSVDGAVIVPWTFESAYGIDWSTVSASAAGRTDAPSDAIKVIKATGDASHLYVYFEVNEGALIDNDGYDYANYSYLYLGNGASTKPYDWQWQGNYTEKISSWIKANNTLGFLNWKSYCSSIFEVHNGVVYYEIALDRSGLSCLQDTTVTVAFEINSIYLVDGNDWGTQGGSTSQIGFAPATWGPALQVNLPSYVAP
ncbi:MAG: hypothetical protein J6X82_03060 [Bacteroidales bacterium]|nr:hypothetical protein [Bacteroidales bacterium]